LLKRTFGRFDEFADKWVTNDAWLVYEAAFDGFNAHLALIQQKQRLPGRSHRQSRPGPDYGMTAGRELSPC
jgi:hypothetical protein